MLNRATRNAHHVLPKSRYRTNVVSVRSNGEKEEDQKANRKPHPSFRMAPVSPMAPMAREKRVSLYRIFARAKGGGEGGGGGGGGTKYS